MSALLNISLNKSCHEFEGICYNGDIVDLLASTILDNFFGELTSLDLDANSNLWRPDETFDNSINSQLTMYDVPLNEDSFLENTSSDYIFNDHLFEDSQNSLSSINFDEIPNELISDPSHTSHVSQPLTSSPNNQIITPVTFEPPFNVSLESNSEKLFEDKLPALYDSLDSSSHSIEILNTTDNDIIKQQSLKTVKLNEDYIDYNVLDNWLDKFCNQTETESTPIITSPEPIITPIISIPFLISPMLDNNSNTNQLNGFNDLIASSPAPSTHSSISSISYNSSVDGGDYLDNRPPVSYLRMIAEAILDKPTERALLTDIYSYVLRSYPYFELRKPAWRNSIRHNLSVNGCFVKNGKAPTGRGFYWSVSRENIDNFRNGDFNRKNRYQLQHQLRINNYIQQQPRQITRTPVHIIPLNQCYAPNFVSKYVPNAPTFSFCQT